MTNQQSNNLKEEFKKWLENKHYSHQTINDYIWQINTIYRAYNCSDIWQGLNENIISIIARHYELLNRKYSLDRITIWYALDYFKKIKNFMPQNNQIIATICIFVKKSKKIICSVPLDKLYDKLVFINEHLYLGNENFTNNTEEETLDITKLSIFANAALKNSKINDIKGVAIHIIYEEKTNPALLQYFLFLQKHYSDTINFSALHSIVDTIKSENPNETTHNHYKIKQQISGQTYLIIEPENENQRLDINFTLTKKDLTKIFDVNITTVGTILKNAKSVSNKTAEYDQEEWEYGRGIAEGLHKEVSKPRKKVVITEYETELRTYYSAENINEYLKEHYHLCKNPSADVNYNRKGYKYWYNRKKFLKILGIGKTSFYKYIYKKIPYTYIDYTDKTVKYYLPEMKKIKRDLLTTRRDYISKKRRKKHYIAVR